MSLYLEHFIRNIIQARFTLTENVKNMSQRDAK